MKHHLQDVGGGWRHFERQNKTKYIHQHVEDRADDSARISLPEAVGEEGNKANVYGHVGMLSVVSKVDESKRGPW